MAKAGARHIEIGISAEDRAQIAIELSKLLADTYTLYLTTHNFHWNVKGPMFNTLHLMFMDQYNELWLATDLIAERIRSLGFAAPGTFVLAMIFLAAFVLYYFINWKYLSTLWGLS